MFDQQQILKQPTKNVDKESFAILFEESLKQQDMRTGEVISAEIVGIDQKFVILNAGLKSYAYISREEFLDDQGKLEANLGDFVTVAIDALENGYGDTILSRDKAKRLASWSMLEKALEKKEFVQGIITGKVKGGLTVMVNGIRAFLPGSLVDIRPIKDTSILEGKSDRFQVIKLDPKRNNVVLSRRAALEESQGEEREKLLAVLKEGDIVNGTVKSLTDYGAFVDLGGIDGLLHITDMAFGRVRHPSDMTYISHNIRVKILRIDRERNRVSLGMKQLGEDPWINIARRYPNGTRQFGKVTNLTDYGAFVEIENGIEGLVHVSEMDWTNKNIAPNKVVHVGQEVEIMVLNIDEERRRISLGMKQCMPNPWTEFAQNYSKGNNIIGLVKSITDFGLFIGLPGNIDGLVHLSDLSWNESGEQAILKYKKGEEVKAIVLGIDIDKERISLGIKQLLEDPFNNFINANDKGSIVSGKVKSIDQKGAIISLNDNVEGYLKVSEMIQEKRDNIRNLLKEGGEIKVLIIGIDRKTRNIQLSIKGKDHLENPSSVQKLQSGLASAASGTTNLGALLKAKLDSQNQ